MWRRLRNRKARLRRATRLTRPENGSYAARRESRDAAYRTRNRRIVGRGPDEEKEQPGGEYRPAATREAIDRVNDDGEARELNQV